MNDSHYSIRKGQGGQRAVFSRRRFLATAGSVGLGGLAAPIIVPRAVLGSPQKPGPNHQIRIGVIGTGIRGKQLIGNLPRDGRVAAICDCHAQRMAETFKPDTSTVQGRLLRAALENDASSCATYQDYRRMFEDTELDAVMIAAPDHHHALAAVLACQAGLDVYVEKPLAVTIGEGRAIVEAARRYDRVVQVGSQQRTMEMNRFACEFIRDGGLGRVSLVQLRAKPGPLRYDQFAGRSATADSSRFKIDLSEEPVPEGLAWDLFCGPTPLRPHNQKLWRKDEFQVNGLMWRGWDQWRSYSGHLMTNWGAHSVDMVQYALGMDESGPVEIWPETSQLEASLDEQWLQKTPPFGTSGGSLADEMRFCPVSMRYANGTVVRFDSSRRLQTAFHGTRGKLLMSRNSFLTEPGDLAADPPDPEVRRKWQGNAVVARPHIENWLACVRTRGVPNAPVETGHRSATVCHLANIARELGRRLRWDPQKEVFVDDDRANGLVDRLRREGWELPEIG